VVTAITEAKHSAEVVRQCFFKLNVMSTPKGLLLVLSR